MASNYQSAYSEDELEQREYIGQCGENLAVSIIETWLDGMPKDLELELTEEEKRFLEASLRASLKSALTEFQQAQWAAALVGNDSFEDWRER